MVDMAVRAVVFSYEPFKGSKASIRWLASANLKVDLVLTAKDDFATVQMPKIFSLTCLSVQSPLMLPLGGFLPI